MRLPKSQNRGAGSFAPWLTIGCGVYAVAGGTLTLLGWFADIPRFIDWPGHGISMKANTAVCAVMSGAALILHTFATSARSVRILGLAVSTVGLLTLLEHLTGVNFGIDTILVDEAPGAEATVAPGRMGPPASTSYFLLGMGLLLSTSTKPLERLWSGVLGTITLLIAVLGFMGYLFDAPALFTLAHFTGIAPQTATILIALSVGLLASVPDRGLAALFAQPDAGGILFRRLLPAIILVPVMLSWLRIKGQQTGLFDMEFGAALRTLVEIVLLTALLAWTARALSRSEAVRGIVDAELKQRDRLLDAVTDNAQVGLFIVSPAHRYLYANRAYAQLYGQEVQSIVGKHLAEVIHDAYETQVRPRLERAFSGERVSFEATVPNTELCGHGDGNDKRFLTVTYEPQKRSNEIECVVVAITDITEIKKTQAQRDALLVDMKQAFREAEHASRLKDEFLATLSHELRTPMTAILGWSQVLHKRLELGQGEGLAQGLQIIERNAKLQAQIIDDLLDMSRIISGKIKLDIQPVRIDLVLQAAIEAIRPASELKGVVVESHYSDMPEMLGDAGRLQQVLYNLLTNAVKFTPKGGRVDIECLRIDSEVEIAVSDTGSGIAPEFLPHVFERFRQQDATTTRSHSGLGLGLGIVKQLVELHGGSVHAASDGVGKGATFTVRVPIPKSGMMPATINALSDNDRGSARVRTGRPDTPRWDLSSLNVLVVDDELDTRHLVCDILKEHHATVHAAGSVQEAMKILEGRIPNVLISDIGMPGEDGYALIRRVRQHPDQKARQLPAIALTAFARNEDRSRAIRAGFDMHLAKPVSVEELIAAVIAVSRNTGE